MTDGSGGSERDHLLFKLRESEAGLRRAQAMAQLGHVITRPDGSFESWSETLPALARIWDIAVTFLTGGSGQATPPPAA